MAVPNDSERRFAAFLKELADSENRAALAKLRRSLSMEPGIDMASWKIIGRFVAGMPRHIEAVYFLAAGLFALHPATWSRAAGDKRPTNLGASFHWLMSKGYASDSLEKRFMAVLGAELEDLAYHLRQLISVLRTNDVPVDWAQLIHDLKRWEWEERPVQQSWARAYWAGYETSAPLAEEGTGIHV